MKKILIAFLLILAGSSVFADTFPLAYEDLIIRSGGQILLTGWFNEYRATGQHSAVDIPANTGSPVVAFRAGKVVGKFFEPPIPGRQRYGNCIIIEDAAGLRWFYAHLSTYEILMNQEIAEGQYIGAVGYSGMNYVCPHLHIECRDPNNKKIFFTDDLAAAARLILAKDPGKYVFDLRGK